MIARDRRKTEVTKGIGVHRKAPEGWMKAKHERKLGKVLHATKKVGFYFQKEEVDLAKKRPVEFVRSRDGNLIKQIKEF